MAKGFPVNSKKEEGRARKAASKNAKADLLREKQEEKDANSWKLGSKDLTKKEEEETARLLKLEKKKERDRLLIEEETSLPRSKEKHGGHGSRSSSIDNSSQPPSNPFESPISSDLDMPLDNTETSDIKETEDRHPEKRMKAAYRKFEDEEMPLLKAQYPSLKYSQLQQLLFKKWKKSPANPMNMAALSHGDN